MDFYDYTWKVSTYRPVELGDVELEILGYLVENGSPFSIYQIYKMLKQISDIENQILKNLEAESVRRVYEQLLEKFKGDKYLISKICSYYNEAAAITNSVNQQQISGATRRAPTSYKNIHKRIKRLAQLKLIEQITGHFERGAKYYRVSTYGLISYIGRATTESGDHIKHNKKDIVIRCLLLQFFEEETIDSFGPIEAFPTIEVRDYLHDCCSVTIGFCKEVWNRIKRYQIEDILPSDKITQKYMSYLDGDEVDQSVLDEIKEYEKRLLKKYQNNGNLRADHHEFRKEPVDFLEFRPFPLNEIYDHIVCRLGLELETKMKSLVNTIVANLGQLVNEVEEIETKEQLDELLESRRNDSIRHILTDKIFFELIAETKRDFNIGYKQFSYYRC